MHLCHTVRRTGFKASEWQNRQERIPILDAPQQCQYDHYYKNGAQYTAGPVAPVSTMWPRRDHRQQQHEQQDHQ